MWFWSNHISYIHIYNDKTPSIHHFLNSLSALPMSKKLQCLFLIFKKMLQKQPQKWKQRLCQTSETLRKISENNSGGELKANNLL